MALTLEVGINIRQVGDKSVGFDLPSGVVPPELNLTEYIEYTRCLLMSVARSVLKDEQASGFDKNPITAVDGKVGRPEAEVRPFGRIEYMSTTGVLGTEVIRDIYENILTLSKVVTGKYMAGNIILVDGRPIATSMSELDAWLKTPDSFRPGEKIIFINVVPYARKLERKGITAFGSQSRTSTTSRRKSRGLPPTMAPNGVYYMASKSAKKSYKYIVNVRFAFTTFAALGISGTDVGGRTSFAIGRKGKPGRPYLYPSIELIIGDRIL